MDQGNSSATLLRNVCQHVKCTIFRSKMREQRWSKSVEDETDRRKKKRVEIKEETLQSKE